MSFPLLGSQAILRWSVDCAYTSRERADPMSDALPEDGPHIPPELLVIADQINRDESPPKISVRQLLQYFGFQRRGLIKIAIV
jgi:hypothetical protein